MFGRKKEKDSPNVITPIVEEIPQATLNTNSDSSQNIPNQQGTNLNININTGSNSDDNNKVASTRNTAKLISNILAIAITGTLVGFAAFSIISFLVDTSTSNSSLNSYLNITNYSYTKTTRILTDFKRDNSQKIKDFSIVGSKLFVGECKLTPTAYSNPNYVFGEGNYGFALYDLETNSHNFNNGRTDIANGKYYIDFSLVSPGKYVFYPIQETSAPETSKSDIAPYSIKYDNPINETFYTLPSKESGRRNKVTIRNNSASPFTLIDVVDTGSTLASGYYDVAIYPSIYAKMSNGEERIEKSDEPSNELVNICKELVSAINNEKSIDNKTDTHLYQATYFSSIEEVSKAKVHTAIAINSSLSKNYVSTYLKADTYSSFSTYILSDDTTLPKYDAFPEIRELTGYLDHSGDAFGGISYNDLVVKKNSVFGIESSIICTTDTNNQNTLGNILNVLRR